MPGLLHNTGRYPGYINLHSIGGHGHASVFHNGAESCSLAVRVMAGDFACTRNFHASETTIACRPPVYFWLTCLNNRLNCNMVNFLIRSHKYTLARFNLVTRPVRESGMPNRPSFSVIVRAFILRGLGPFRRFLRATPPFFPY